MVPRRELHAPLATRGRQQQCPQPALLVLTSQPVGQDEPGPQLRALCPSPCGPGPCGRLPTWRGGSTDFQNKLLYEVQWAVQHCYLEQVTEHAGGEVPLVHAWPDLLRSLGVWEPDLQRPGDNVLPAAPCHLAQQLPKTQRPSPEQLAER